jgi:hypothetical protein
VLNIRSLLPLVLPPSTRVHHSLTAAGNYVALLGNILFPLIAFGGLFFLFRRAQGGSGGGGGPMGGMGGPMEFGRSKSKFQEVPETGVTFADVAVSAFRLLHLLHLSELYAVFFLHMVWHRQHVSCHAHAQH